MEASLVISPVHRSAQYAVFQFPIADKVHHCGGRKLEVEIPRVEADVFDSPLRRIPGRGAEIPLISSRRLFKARLNKYRPAKQIRSARPIPCDGVLRLSG